MLHSPVRHLSASIYLIEDSKSGDYRMKKKVVWGSVIIGSILILSSLLMTKFPDEKKHVFKIDGLYMDELSYSQLDAWTDGIISKDKRYELRDISMLIYKDGTIRSMNCEMFENLSYGQKNLSLHWQNDRGELVIWETLEIESNYFPMYENMTLQIMMDMFEASSEQIFLDFETTDEEKMTLFRTFNERGDIDGKDTVYLVADDGVSLVDSEYKGHHIKLIYEEEDDDEIVEYEYEDVHGFILYPHSKDGTIVHYMTVIEEGR